MNTYPQRKIPYTPVSPAVLLSGIFMLPGTGGDVSKINIDRLTNPPAQYGRRLVAIDQVKVVIVSDTIIASLALEPLEDLNHIMTVFNSNISELAKMLRVSRQAIYKWENGEGISRESAERLYGLARAADVFVEAGLIVNLFMLRRTVADGQSFLEIVESGGSAVEAARTLVQVVQIGQRQRALIDQRLATKETRKTVSIIEEFPLAYEDD